MLLSQLWPVLLGTQYMFHTTRESAARKTSIQTVVMGRAPGTPVCERLTQEDQEFKASLSYIARAACAT